MEKLTGVLDKNGKQISDGDTIIFAEEKYEVYFCKKYDMWRYTDGIKSHRLVSKHSDSYEIVNQGNKKSLFGAINDF